MTTTTTPTVGKAVDLGLDPTDGPWVSICKAHGTIANSATRTLARAASTLDFCDQCRWDAEGQEMLASIKAGVKQQLIPEESSERGTAPVISEAEAPAQGDAGSKTPNIERETIMTDTKQPPAAKAPAKAKAATKATKAEAPKLTAEELAAQKATAKLRKQLQAVTDRKAQLVREERVLVEQLREAGVSWRHVADDLGMSHVGAQRRYRDLVEAAREARNNK